MDDNNSATAEQVPDAGVAGTPVGLGVSLSGGGVRATFFSAGVLLYLVRCGLNSRVRRVVSVSGGSVTNAAIALGGDYSTMSENRYRDICANLNGRLATHGAFFMPPVKSLLVGSAIQALSYLLGFYVGFSIVSGSWILDRYVIGSLTIGYAIGFLGVLLVRLMLRAHLQRRRFDKLLRESTSGPRNQTLSSLPESNVDYVICATDLKGGVPFFFTRDRIFSPWLGWAPSGKTLLSHALYASAAFPLVLPPLRFKVAGRKFAGGEIATERPHTTRLADGGVFNNLGTDYHRLVAEEAQRIEHLATPRERFAGAEVSNVILVNVSAPVRQQKRLLSPLFRTVSVLYANTISPRLELARHSAGNGPATSLIDASYSPKKLAELEAESLQDEEASSRAATFAAKLQSAYPEALIDGLVREATSLKTTLDPIGTEVATRLVQQGYLSAMAVLHTRFGARLAFEDEEYFRHLIEAPA